MGRGGPHLPLQLCSSGTSAVGPCGDTHSHCPSRPGHPRGVSMPFPATPVADHCTLATLSIWSLVWKNSGSRPLCTVFTIFFLFLPTAVFITSLKRRMESSRSRLDSWQGRGRRELSTLPTVSRGVSVADGRGAVLGSDPERRSRRPDLQLWLNGPRALKGPGRGAGRGRAPKGYARGVRGGPLPKCFLHGHTEGQPSCSHRLSSGSHGSLTSSKRGRSSSARLRFMRLASSSFM